MKRVYSLWFFVMLFYALSANAQTALKITLLFGTTPASGIRVILNDPNTGAVVADKLADANGIADFGNIGAARTTFSVVTTRMDSFRTSKRIETFVNIPVGNYTFQVREANEPTLATFNVQLTNIPAGTASTALFVAGGGGSGSGPNGFIGNVKVTPRNLQSIDGKFSLTAEAMDARGTVLGWGSLLDASAAAVNGTTQSIPVNLPPIPINFSAPAPVVLDGGELLRKGVIFDIRLGAPHDTTFLSSGTLKLCSIVGLEKIFLQAHTQETAGTSARASGKIFIVPPNPSSWQITLPDLSINFLSRSTNGNTVSWTQSGADLGKLDVAVAHFEWKSTTAGGTIEYRWSLFGNPATTSLTLPTLPGDLADRVPPTAGVEVHLELDGLDNVTGFEDLLQKASAANGNFDAGVLFNATEIVTAEKSLKATTTLPTSISLTSGNNQSTQISAVLPNPFVVTVTDALGNPVSGVSVTFAIATVPTGATGQSLSVTNATTGANGQATSVLTLGNKVGTYTVTATATGLSGSPLTFTATATAVVSVELVESLPNEFHLFQNYPNPFNPSTTIQFSLPHSGYVTLRIYNTLGQEVTSLVAENISAGRYKVEWNANGLVSGIYLYRLQAREFVETKKLVLLK